MIRNRQKAAISVAILSFGFMLAFGGIIFSYIILPSLDLRIVNIPYVQILSLVIISILLGTCAGLIAAYQLRKFKLHDTLKELSS